MKLNFFGAARSVTGSCFMLECGNHKLLIDCGMRQGADADTRFGEGEFPFTPSDIEAVLLTHAHIDHMGLIPLLTKRGFTGGIYATGATSKLATIMLPDSGHIQEQEAEWKSRKNERAGKQPEEPLYTVKDAQEAEKFFKPVEYNTLVDILPGVRAKFIDAGHLLGSACVEVWLTEDGKTVKLVFSGDIGRDDRPIINDPQAIDSADYVIMEGTYGDRLHEQTTDKEGELAEVLRRALQRGGNIVIPAFAVGRTQELLYYIREILQKGSVPGLEKIPVYIDSPLGIRATRIYEECRKGYYDKEALSVEGSPFEFASLRVAETVDESRGINTLKEPKIIISSSGMCEAGRIKHHLKHNLYRADSTILFTGYQAVGTLGRSILDGAKRVKIMGEDVRINAAIERIEGFSGHADQTELLTWLTDIQGKPRHVFLVHGEADVLTAFSEKVKAAGYSVNIPEMYESFDLGEGRVQPTIAMVEHRVVNATRESREQLSSELERISALLEKAKAGPKTAETDLKLMLLREDIRSLVDKWDRLL